MQEAIMNFFHSLSTPFLDALGEGITFFGEQTVFILITAYILWCGNKRSGFALFSTLFVALFTMNALKAIVRQERPFKIIEGLSGKRLETATGYSFPSGHTTGASAFYSSLAYIVKKRWLSILCAVIILLVGISRMYLLVHWPLDVAAGLILGIVSTFVLTAWLLKLYDNNKLVSRFSWIIGGSSAVVSLAMAVLIDAGTIDPVAFTDMMKLLALAAGGYIGFAIDRNHISYGTSGDWKTKIVRFVFGIAIVLLIQGAKALLPEHLVFSFIRYALTGLWATALYPLIGKHIPIWNKKKLFTREDT